MKALRLALAIACFLCCATIALAQDDPITMVFPEVKEMPAPDWLEEGLRLTYYVSSASVPEDRNLYYQDENGTWVDQYGNRYRPEEALGTGGHEYLEVSVAAVSEGQAVLDQRTFGFLGVRSTLTPSTRFSASRPVGGNERWINPRFLNSLAEVNRAGLKILRTSYPLQNKVYKAVRIHSSTEKGYLTYVYDLDSGVLLYWGTATSGRPQGAVTEAGTPARTGLLAQGTLVNVRRALPPWANAAPPDLLRTLQRLLFRGTTTLEVGYAYPVQMDMRVLSRGNRHLVFRVVQTQATGAPASLPLESTVVSAGAQVGGMWLSPAAMPQLKPGQVIDEDPVTGVQVVVGGQTRGPDGRPLMHIREAAATFVSDHYYDWSTGLLTYYVMWVEALGSRMELQLVQAQ